MQLKHIGVLSIILILTVIMCGCTEYPITSKKSLFCVGTLIDFDVQSHQTLGNQLIKLYLDTNKTYITCLDTDSACKLAKGQRVYLNVETNQPWVEIDGKYY